MYPPHTLEMKAQTDKRQYNVFSDTTCQRDLQHVYDLQQLVSLWSWCALVRYRCSTVWAYIWLLVLTRSGAK